jgi:hypothetical protein
VVYCFLNQGQVEQLPGDSVFFTSDALQDFVETVVNPKSLPKMTHSSLSILFEALLLPVHNLSQHTQCNNL